MRNIVYILVLFVISSCGIERKEKPGRQVIPDSLVINQISIKDYDSILPQITIGDFCLCQTNLSELEYKGYNFTEIDIEDYYYLKSCRSNNSDVDFYKGFISDSIKGVIFRKEENSDIINKIRLTKDFEGTLPNGHFIKLADLNLNDLKTELNGFKWQSKDCSDYWNYTNDTLRIFIKMIQSKPRYPIDEEFYSKQPIEAIEMVLSCYSIYGPEYVSNGLVYQKPKYAPLKDTHLNCSYMFFRSDFGTKIKEAISFGKKTNIEYLKLGKRLEYNFQHQLILEEYYDNKGRLIRKDKLRHTTRAHK
ncbi:hypothetical protein [Labilibacter marinus]|uniref:hypothetical protein n=1 Tax=Labilibacter marinus TaxID=1477105 RepID=UPI00082C43B6|nr:hypothetical protein [Labilibacter marinus]